MLRDLRFTYLFYAISGLGMAETDQESTYS